MAEIEETRLAGVGVRHDFVCAGGTRVGVITRHTGRRELVIYDRDDPDAVAASVDLSADESEALADLLGGSAVTRHVERSLGAIEGLAIDWLTLPPTFRPRTIGDTEMRTRTGVSVIAIVRDGSPIPAPGPADELRPGDVLVVTGTAEGIEAAVRQLQR